mmetsp:Transcript_20494/g.44384  ORF Transcript_20494/g.44384 Transcript_20494/m.44384 type:complete len:142 (+) Transcript_20494:127-552(+)|eukprot:CAMPEP_0168753972 /NCGR_PEP_ID=MMETSP0724-20121128/19252_1 /TAXON_ID=265536 /ORGANISM="Amphiprora sp., Strain CCMP467" /LENGTH=141 /DNA_ID=CAMNT_0008802419 /DNA_START=112 /DNA_END=537 /DNA_ORIENTATION=+
MPNYICNACIFCYTACDTDDIKLVLKKRDECCCFISGCCIAINDDGYGVGLDKNMAAVAAAKAGKSVGNICMINLFCCQCGLKFPEVCCGGASHCLCIKEGHAIPFDDDTVKEPLCAFCFISLMPDVGILKEAPSLPNMDR